MLTEIRPSDFCWNEPFPPSWKNGFRCCCSWISQSSCLSPTSYCIIHGSYCTFSQERVNDHKYYGSCSVQGRKGSLNPLQNQPVSQYWNFHMVSDWISVKGTFTAFCGTVQVGLVKAPLSFSGFNIAWKKHGRSKDKKPSGKHLTMIIFYLCFQFLCTIPNFPTGEAGDQ